ncbi:protein translocase subunit SecDF [Porphyromonas sp.]
MQNKGFVTFVTVSLALICAFYLSFSLITNHYDSKAEQMGEAAGKAYLDSMANEKVFLGYTLKEARKQQIGLGLDLKGGMNVILKLNAGDLVKGLAGNTDDPNFQKAIQAASKSTSQGNYIDQFVAEYKKLSPGVNLAVVFGSGDLRDQINPSTSEDKVIELLKEKYNSAVEASFNVLSTRIDRFGVVAPNLQRLEGQGRILVELPGVKDPERVRELLQRSANLQFWRTYTFDEVSSDLMGLSDRLLALSAPAARPVPVATDSVAAKEGTAHDSAALTTATPAVAPSQLASIDTLSKYLQLGGRGGATVGLAQDRDRNKIDSLLALATEYHLLPEDLSLLWGAKPIQDPQTRKLTNIYELYAIRTNRSMKPDLSGDVVTSSKADVDHNRIGSAEPQVSMSMNQEGAQIWARLTKESIGRSIAIVLDGVVYSAPNVNNEITGGQSSISGNFTIEEANDLANVLNSGKMETSVVIEQENVVGPTLGKASIQAGIISFAIALVLLMVYMCLAYGFIPGMIANLALIVNSFFTLGILASFNAVLTLSGIAGLVLTLGMAVDANVLINERIKEELRHGKGMTRAIADGYGNAFSAIFDSNLTTIITGVVLFYFGAGPIRGFATTLIIGLISSFITAVFLTRMVFEALDKRHKLDNVTYTTAMTKNLLVNPTYNFLGARKKGYILPVALIIAGLIGIFTIGLNNGIEFSGGRNYIIKFDQKVDNQQIREKLAPQLDQKLVLTAIGTEGDQIRVSTNYLIDDSGDAVEEQIKDKLYQGLNSFYKTQPTKAEFDGYIVSSQKVSASMSNDIKTQALIAVGLSLLFMAIYILIRFRNVAFSIGAFASVTVTTLMIIAIYVLLWKVLPFTMEVDQNFIAALLAIIGYAINDVVIVFDRIREEVANHPQADRYEVINGALNSTLSRTLNTSFTTFLVMIIVFAFGGATMRSFTFAILLGILFGTYCTLFVATPIAYEIAKRRREKAASK